MGTGSFNTTRVLFVILASLALSLAARPRFYKNPMRRWPSLSHLRTTTAVLDQASTVSDMIVRLLGTHAAQYYTVTVNSSMNERGRDVFVVDNAAGGGPGIRISGSSGVAAAMGFQYYAKMYGGCHFSWSGDQTATLSSPPPRLPLPVRIVANDLFRYYQNVCTVSYSTVWWNWTRWEREIDWMALNGINLPLAFVGQEEIWRRVYLALGFNQTDMDIFFSGPAFLAWNRMGNLDGWGGPLPQDFYDGQLRLQHQILDRMRGFGMTPVLPAFSGHVPQAIENYYPNATVTRLSDWGRFNTTYCCTYLLDHADPLFAVIGQNFIREMSAEFGVNHVYNCDTFNEMEPPTPDPTFVSNVGRAIFGAMTAADPLAVWLMQGWIFQDFWYWNSEMSEALIRSVPLGRMIVLDLQSELHPQYGRLDSYFGQPWIWCMLLNFGGVKGLYGTVDNVNQGPFLGRASPNSTMVGTGLTPEGIEQNDVMFELMNEMAYLRIPVDLEAWFPAFARRRYGVEDAEVSAAWTLMAHTVFNCTTSDFHGRYIITLRPKFNLSSVICYNPKDFFPVWSLFVAAASNGSRVGSSDLFRHDLVDVTREALVATAAGLYQKMEFSYFGNHSDYFRDYSQLFLETLSDLDRLLTTDRRFLVGPWLSSARALAANAVDAALYEYNARNQITLWGPSGQILDYATKQWQGIVSDYYLPRWRLFVDRVQLAMDSRSPFNQSGFDEEVLQNIESPFTFDTKGYPQNAVGDPVAEAQRLCQKWLPIINDIGQF